MLKGLRSSDKIKKLLEMPDKLFPDEGGTLSNKALVDHVFDSIDKDGSQTISYDEFEAYCLSKIQRQAALRQDAEAFQAAGETHAARRQHLLVPQLAESSQLLERQVLHAIEDYDELARSLDTQHRRKAGLQRDMARMDAELHAVDGDIARQHARALELKARLEGYRQGHNSVVQQLDTRVAEITRQHAHLPVHQGAGGAPQATSRTAQSALLEPGLPTDVARGDEGLSVGVDSRLVCRSALDDRQARERWHSGRWRAASSRAAFDA